MCRANRRFCVTHSMSDRGLVKSAGEPDLVDAERRRGRGARSNVSGRFESERREFVDDGWESGADLPAFKTTLHQDSARRWHLCRMLVHHVHPSALDTPILDMEYQIGQRRNRLTLDEWRSQVSVAEYYVLHETRS